MEVRCKKVIVTCHIVLQDVHPCHFGKIWCPSSGVVLSFHGQPWVWGDISSNDFVPRVSRSPPAGVTVLHSWFLMCCRFSGVNNSPIGAGWNDWWQVFFPWQNQRATWQFPIWNFWVWICHVAQIPFPKRQRTFRVPGFPRNLWPTSKVCKASEFREGCK